MPSFGKKSQERLAELDPRLQRILTAVIQHTDFTILCGHRPKVEQDAAVAAGNSKLPWPLSKHNQKPSLAVDVAPWPVDWQDTKRFAYLAGAIMQEAQSLGIRLAWGGHWKGLVDMPHFELLN